MDRSNFYSIIHLSLAFFLIFTSYNATQLLQTSLTHSHDGAYAVGIIYLVFCLSNLALSSYLTRLLGVRLTLFLSSVTYILFVAANIKYNRWALFISASLLGFGAALLWTAQGVYVAVSTMMYERKNNLPSASQQSFMNGIFFGVFQLNQTVGNLVVSYLFHIKIPQSIIFVILTIVSGLGTLCLFFLRSIKVQHFSEINSIVSSLSIVVDSRFTLLIPTMCYSGLVQGFIYGTVPPFINDKSQKYFVYAIFGLINFISSILFGKFSDLLGRRLVVLYIAAVSHIIVFGLMLTVWEPPLNQNSIETFIAIAICLSIGDAILTNQLYSIMGMLYSETRPADAFAFLKAFQAGSTAIGFIAHIYVKFSTEIWCLLILLIFTFVTLVYEHHSVVSLDTGKTIAEKKNKNGDRIEGNGEENVHLSAMVDTNLKL